MEEDIFLKKMKGVKALKKDKTIITKKTNNKLNVNKKNIINEKVIPEKTTFNKKKINPTLSPSFSDLNKDLKKGKVKIDRKLDLHGYSLFDAYNKFKNEVIKNYNQNKRCLLIITGKGVHQKNNNSDNTHPKLFYGKIKNSIVSWIEDADIKKYVLTYQDAGFDYGGDGAIFVYLRKKKI